MHIKTPLIGFWAVRDCIGLLEEEEREEEKNKEKRSREREVEKKGIN